MLAGGIEPPTYGLETHRSIRLSYASPRGRMGSWRMLGEAIGEGHRKLMAEAVTMGGAPDDQHGLRHQLHAAQLRRAVDRPLVNRQDRVGRHPGQPGHHHKTMG